MADSQTEVFSAAKLRLSDVEKIMRAQAAAAKGESAPRATSETTVERFIAAFRVRVDNNSKLAASSKGRALDSIKTLIKTWPELPGHLRRLPTSDCNVWAVAALREGTGFIAPNVKTKRKGIAPSSFNKCVDTLRAILEIAHEQGMVYQNPAKEVSKARKRQKRLELPSAVQFQTIVKQIAIAGSRWSTDAADLVRLLAYSGARLSEATGLRW